MFHLLLSVHKGHPAIGSPDLLLQAHSFDQPPLDDGPALAGLVGVHGPDSQIFPLVPGELAT